MRQYVPVRLIPLLQQDNHILMLLFSAHEQWMSIGMLSDWLTFL